MAEARKRCDYYRTLAFKTNLKKKEKLKTITDMKIFFTILIFILIAGIVTIFIGKIGLNIVGLPGGYVGRKSISRTEPKYILGLILALLAHNYLYLSYMIYIITWTKLNVTETGFPKYLIWFFCMVATIAPIQKIYENAKKEISEFSNEYQNTQLDSIYLTQTIALFSFFIFVFFPESINPLWTWVLNIGYPI